MQYGIIGWIVVGLIAGILAKVVMPGKDPGGIIVTILIGIAGGLLGGFAASRLGIGRRQFHEHPDRHLRRDRVAGPLQNAVQVARRLRD